MGSAETRRPAFASLAPNGDTDGASGRGWDGLGEQERRERIEALDADAVRALAVSMPVIEQAKGVLMACYGLDAAEAFSLLTRLSSTRNAKVRAVAGAVVAAAVSNRTDPALEPLTSAREQVRQVVLDRSVDEQERRS